MTTPIPTGQVRTTETGDRELVHVRTFRATVEDVWASITESERTARWFASWSGEAGRGRTVEYRLVAEGDQPPGQLTIEECEPPVHLRVSVDDEAGHWEMEARLRDAGDGHTELVFIHRSDSAISVGEIGPGWEYYLDRLTASRDGAPMPDFDDYYPAQKSYFEEQIAGV